MSLFSKLVGGRDAIDPPESPFSGGDGSDLSHAVVVNCASMTVANALIDGYVSERHGRPGDDWVRGVEFFVGSLEISPYTVRSIGIKCRSGVTHTYFFDVSRPMDATKNLAKAIGVWPKDVD